MRDLPPDSPYRRAAEAQDDGMPAPETHAWGAVSYLISGPVMLGAAGWGLDRLFGTAFLLPVGILAGMALSMYVIWVRYGTG